MPSSGKAMKSHIQSAIWLPISQAITFHTVTHVLIICLSIKNKFCFATAYFAEIPDLKTSRNEEFITLTVCSSG